jgi:hypothetical protein
MCRNHRRAEKAGGPFRAGAFPRSVIDEILAQPGCEGVRIYLAKNEAGDSTLVALGTDADGRDLDQGIIVDDVFPCPPFCSGGSFLEE